MSYLDERTDITTLWNTEWNTGNPISPTPPVAYPNRKFTPPADFAPFASFHILNGEAKQNTIGCDNNLYRHPGVIKINIFVGKESGEIDGLTLSDYAMSIFRSKQFNGILTRAPYISYRGNQKESQSGDDSPYFMYSVECKFQRDEYL